MKISVLFFGVLAEEAGTDRTAVENIDDTDSLKKHLTNSYGFLGKYNWMISVNKTLIRENTRLNDGDEVALLPPFAGG